jgi:hypothetical protein
MTRRKYGNKPVEVDGIRFDSKREAARWCDLRLLERSGVIRDLERQVRFRLVVNDVEITTAVIDFRYVDIERGPVLEDVKGYTPDADPVTRLWRIKHKLIQALHGIEVEIIK